MTTMTQTVENLEVLEQETVAESVKERNYDLSNRVFNLTELILETSLKKRISDTGIRRELSVATRYSLAQICNLENQERGLKYKARMSKELADRASRYFTEALGRTVVLDGNLSMPLRA